MEPSSVTTLGTGLPSRPALRTRAYSDITESSGRYAFCVPPPGADPQVLSIALAASLERRQARARACLPEGASLDGLVFCCEDGSPVRPQSVLTELRRRTAELGLPRIGVHDLRHTAATIMISSQVPLAVVSKTLRHSTLSTTVNLYGHLLPHAARDAVTALENSYEKADLAASSGSDATAA